MNFKFIIIISAIITCVIVVVILRSSTQIKSKMVNDFNLSGAGRSLNDIVISTVGYSDNKKMVRGFIHAYKDESSITPCGVVEIDHDIPVTTISVEGLQQRVSSTCENANWFICNILCEFK